MMDKVLFFFGILVGLQRFPSAILRLFLQASSHTASEHDERDLSSDVQMKSKISNLKSITKNANAYSHAL